MATLATTMKVEVYDNQHLKTLVDATNFEVESSTVTERIAYSLKVGTASSTIPSLVGSTKVLVRNDYVTPPDGAASVVTLTYTNDASDSISMPLPPGEFIYVGDVNSTLGLVATQGSTPVTVVAWL